MPAGFRSRGSHQALSAVCAALAMTAMALLPGRLFPVSTSVHAHAAPVRSVPAAAEPGAAGPPPARDAGQDPAPRAAAAPVPRHPAAARRVERVDSERAPARTTRPRPTPKATDRSDTPASTHVVRSSPQSRIADAVLGLLNQERLRHGRTRLRMNAKLIDSAHGHNLQMARQNTMSHQLPGEPYFATRILDAGYGYDWAGENVGWNSEMSRTGVLALEIEMFDEVPPDDGHRQNILSAHFRDVGIDIYFDDVNHKVWLTEDFGHPR